MHSSCSLCPHVIATTAISGEDPNASLQIGHWSSIAMWPRSKALALVGKQNSIRGNAATSLERKWLREIKLAIGVMISGNAADDVLSGNAADDG